jgi:uncharacterized protein
MSHSINDGLVNLITGLGGSKDPSAGNKFAARAMDKAELGNAYRNWLVRKCVDIPVDDAFRKGRYVKTNEKDDTKIKEFYELEKRLDVKGAFVQAAKYGRLYGGAVVLIATGDLDWSKPIVPGVEITRLLPLSRHDIKSVEVNEIGVTDINFRKPQFYMFGETRIHYSRVIQFDGDILEYSDYKSNANWHGSVVQRILDAVEPAQSAIQNCSALVNMLSTDVFKTPGFSEKIASIGESGAMITRFQMAAYMRSNLNMMVLDSEEEYIRNSANLSGLPDTMMSFFRLAAGAADIPSTRLLGDSASGLNATGEGDLRNYYDRVASDQSVLYEPKYNQIDALLVPMIWGNADVGFTSVFEPLWEISDAERATLELNRAQRDNVYIAAGVLTEAIIARQLQEDETYTIGADYIEALESFKEKNPDDTQTEE